MNIITFYKTFSCFETYCKHFELKRTKHLAPLNHTHLNCGKNVIKIIYNIVHFDTSLFW